MDFVDRYFFSLFINRRFYLALAGFIVLFICAFYFPFLELPAIALFLLFIISCCVDYYLLFFTRRKVTARRVTNNRFSNGDENRIDIVIKNELKFRVSITVIDELPPQLQIRDWKRQLSLRRNEQKKISWFIKPLQRGEYHFGNIHLFVSTPLCFFSRKFTSEGEEIVPVYPAFLQLHKYELLSNATLQSETGTKRMRKIGQSMEFEQIKEYVSGDDIRTLNWKASARNAALMVNNYME